MSRSEAWSRAEAELAHRRGRDKLKDARDKFALTLTALSAQLQTDLLTLYDDPTIKHGALQLTVSVVVLLEGKAAATARVYASLGGCSIRWPNVFCEVDKAMVELHFVHVTNHNDSGEGIMKIFQYEGPHLDPLAIAQKLNTDINARV